MTIGPPTPADWIRISGAFANASHVPAPIGAEPVIGVTAYACSCCGKRWIAIACVAESGHEINVALPIDRAPDLIDALLSKIESLLGPGELNPLAKGAH